MVGSLVRLPISSICSRGLSVVHNKVLCRFLSSERDDPYSKTYKIFKDDFTDIKQLIFDGSMTPRKHKFPSHCDVLVLGGGVMGSSTAFWLKQRALDGLKIVVVDRDFTVKFFDYNQFQKSSTVLSVGGLRQQFSLKENIELSLYSADFFRNIDLHLGIYGEDPPDIQFNPASYLFLATDASAHILKENVDLQTSLGAKIELLSQEGLKKKFPWINNEGIALASHGLANEGWFDPWCLLTAFRKKCVSLGVEHVEAEVVDFTLKSSVDVPFIDLVKVKLKSGEIHEIKCSICVVACGPHSGAVTSLMTSEFPPIPVEPKKRYVYNVHCPDGPGLACPLVVDPSGTYFRREGLAGNYLCGRSPLENEEPPVDDLEVDYEYFNSHVWPLIAARCPAFNNAKLKSAWAGYYDQNTFDENAFIGLHPGFFNVILATGFSGHGIQQSPAVGRAISEIIIDGGFKTIDLSRFSYKRYLNDEPLYESNIV